VSSDYKLRLLSICQELPEEQFETLILRFDALNAELERFVAILSYLNPYLRDPIDQIQTSAEGLCEGCANPCSEKIAGKVQCKEYSEYIIEKCSACYYWDVETCTYAGTCERAEHFDPIDEEAKKTVMPVHV
jgi:hypothetical protein